MGQHDNLEDARLPVLFFKLRAVTLALGECATPPWWGTGFLDDTGLSFLQRLYPRSFLKAAVEAAGRAACAVHDRATGMVGVYHLFRLPELIESEILRLEPDQADEFPAVLKNALGRPDELLKLLQSMCAGGRAVAATGAKRIGEENRLLTVQGLRETAAVYHAAFKNHSQAFPYFTTDRSG
ncbi:MAG: BrxE family protein [Verrucomicrobiaceae bacterium]|nr:BrxE family protein [Verrucomicrobiaceae bacterium]